MAKKKKKKKNGPPPVPTSSPLPGWGVGPGLWSRTTGMMEKDGKTAYKAYVTKWEPPRGYYDENLAVTPSASRGAPPPVKQRNYYPEPLPGYVPPPPTNAPPTSNTTPTPKPKGGNAPPPSNTTPKPKGGKGDPKTDRAKVIEQAMGAHRTANPIRTANPSPYSDPYKDMTTEQLSRHFEAKDRERRMKERFGNAQIGRVGSGRHLHTSDGTLGSMGMQNPNLNAPKDDPKGQFQAGVGFIAETAAFGGAASLVARIPWARILTRKDSPRSGDPYWGSQAKDSARARAAAAREKTKLERPVSGKKKTPKPGPTVKGKSKGKPDDRPGKTKPGESSTKPLPKTKGTRAQRKKQREKMLRDKDKKKKK